MVSAILDLQKKISEKNLDALLVSSVPNITYLTGYSNFSKDEREAFLLITKKVNFIFTDGRYSEDVKKQVKNFKLIEISYSSPLENILKKIVKKYEISKLGIEENNLTVSEYKKFRKIFKRIVKYDLETLRILKGQSEIINIKKACGIGDDAFKFILPKLKIGISEKSIAFEIENFIRKQGADISFGTLVAFGKNSSVPHHKTGNTKLRKNQIVLLDFGVKFENYCSDMTRTVFIGNVNAEIRKMYQTVLGAQKRAIEELKIGAKVSNIDRLARAYIIEQGFPTIPHSLGHGIGLEVHESPRLAPKSKDILKENMVFTIEPGIYIPNFGGIRIEDVALLTKSGANVLTHSPKSLIEV